MPSSVEAIRSYVNGKKYNKLRHEAQYDNSDLSQHIVPNTKRGLEHLLFCKLTLRHINNSPADIDVHIRGRRFQRALARWENCQKTGETFKPLASLKQKGPATSWDRPQKKGAKGSNSDSEQEDDDNQSDLSDLYPDADFAMSEDEEGSEFEDEKGDDVRHDNEDGRVIMDVESDSGSEFGDLDLVESTMDADYEPGSSKNRTVTNSDNTDITKISDFKNNDKSKSAARKRSSKALKVRLLTR
ncbi:surfeit locus protein 2-like [Liolophura sinensis]|uniref:surfeit locus protein 2-like n=1 Tax=Liolophura sinensis TaxID=3198878 RepID=UPI0031584A6C